jgi:hypothetical protein
MPTRTEIIDTLAASHEKLHAFYQALTPAERERACTPSEVASGASWNPKDHLTHLAAVERAFQGMVRRTLQGHQNPTGFGDIKEATNREEILAKIHQFNQDHVETHHTDSLETMLADLDTARATTLALLAECTNEQITATVAGAPWSDGTIGGVLLTNAHHAIQHMTWVEEGLHSAS